MANDRCQCGKVLADTDVCPHIRGQPCKYPDDKTPITPMKRDPEPCFDGLEDLL